jgi:hypothetical protein
MGGMCGIGRVLEWFRTEDQVPLLSDFLGAGGGLVFSVLCGWCHGIDLCLVSVAALADSSGKAREGRQRRSAEGDVSWSLFSGSDQDFAVNNRT